MTISAISKEELESRRDALIHQYMELQDIIDDYNQQVYDICCAIEAINISLNNIKESAKSGNNGRKTKPKRHAVNG